MINVKVAVRDRLPGLKSVLRSAGLAAGREFGAAVVDEMQSRVPVRTGQLRDGLGVGEAGEAGQGWQVQVVSEQSYWAHVEYGTRHAVAQPFIQPAVDALRGRLAELVSGSVDEAVRGY